MIDTIAPGSGPPRSSLTTVDRAAYVADGAERRNAGRPLLARTDEGTAAAAIATKLAARARDSWSMALRYEPTTLNVTSRDNDVRDIRSVTVIPTVSPS